VLGLALPPGPAGTPPSAGPPPLGLGRAAPVAGGAAFAAGLPEPEPEPCSASAAPPPSASTSTTAAPISSGRRDGPRMGELVRQYGLVPDLVISSDAVRARLTAEAMAEAAHYAGEVVLDQQLYLASPADILSLLRTVRERADTVMIVGHNPGLEELVEQLTGEGTDLPTAALAQIVLPIDRWRDLKPSTRGTLVGHWRPKELP